MRALRALLVRFHAKIDDREVVDEEKMEEGRMMERLFPRLKSLEDEDEAGVEAEDRGKSLLLTIGVER